MKQIAHLLNIFFILFLLTVTNVKAVIAGPHFSYSPSSGTYSVNETFSVTVKVDSASVVIGGVDVIGTYDSSMLELISLTQASPMVFDGFGGCPLLDKTTLGEFGVGCLSEQTYNDKAVNGDLAVLNFRAKKTGTAKVEYKVCSSATSDNNIFLTSSITDVIVCSENVPGIYIIKEGTSPAPTSTPNISTPNTSTLNTATPTTSFTSTSNTTNNTAELPQTGGVGTTFGLIVFGIISLASAVFLKFL